VRREVASGGGVRERGREGVQAAWVRRGVGRGI
jgi:hypothetical protein